MRCWKYQDFKQVKAKGTEAASWYVGWLDPAGKRHCKSCGPGSRGKAAAEQLRRKIEASLITGTYEETSNKTWKAFREEYAEKILDGMEAGTWSQTVGALDRFEEKIRPGKMLSITSRTIAEFVAKRRLDPGKARGSTLSRASINKELRHLRAVLKKAHRWGYLPKVPEFEFLKEVKKLPVYVTPEHFSLMFAACDGAEEPSDIPNVAPADWWRALLVMAYMTGWRISEMLLLPWEDVDLDAGTAITRGDTNKGRRDEIIPLHPVIVEHLRKIKAFDPFVFPWNHRHELLYSEFDAIQARAGVKPDRKAHYTFHDFRRGFATMNADRLTPDALQSLMRHQAYATTQRYISMARQLTRAVDGLYVPDLGQANKGAV